MSAVLSIPVFPVLTGRRPAKRGFLADQMRLDDPASKDGGRKNRHIIFVPALPWRWQKAIVLLRGADTLFLPVRHSR